MVGSISLSVSVHIAAAPQGHRYLSCDARPFDCERFGALPHRHRLNPSRLLFLLGEFFRATSAGQLHLYEDVISSDLHINGLIGLPRTCPVYT